MPDHRGWGVGWEMVWDENVEPIWKFPSGTVSVFTLKWLL